MRRHAPVLLAALAAAAACAPAATTSTTAGPAPARPALSQRAALVATIDSLVSAPRFRNAHWGVLIVDAAAGDTIYSRNAGKLFIPA
ncbi:MAG TPA: hypothetical protein VFJ74_03100, partial [Gemmatimonadaceae bacterium]|nr:hypothetical protein [Gemmatimonadaceae bacterium]